MHDYPLIETLAGALTAALVCGWITQRLGLSTLVGYMLAGLAVGPFTPGYVADNNLAQQMAEIGVILLMFEVGMHFHPKDLFRVWRIAVPGAIAQTAIATLAGWLFARWFGWSHVGGLIFGMGLAVASTVVLLRMLVDHGLLGGDAGPVAVGWLLVEDMLTVLALVVLPSLAAVGDGASSWPLLARDIGLAIAKTLAFAALAWIVGTGIVSKAIDQLGGVAQKELFTLAIFVVALGVALIAAHAFNVSTALGAFFAGLIAGQSRAAKAASEHIAPFRDVFTAIFFVSIGMLFRPDFVLQEPWKVVAAASVVLLLKPLVGALVVLVLRGTRDTVYTVAVGLAQIGEFSFIMGSLGAGLGLLPREAMDALIVVALLSIAVNPLLFGLAFRGRRAPQGAQ